MKKAELFAGILRIFAIYIVGLGLSALTVPLVGALFTERPLLPALYQYAVAIPLGFLTPVVIWCIAPYIGRKLSTTGTEDHIGISLSYQDLLSLGIKLAALPIALDRIGPAMSNIYIIIFSKKFYPYEDPTVVFHAQMQKLAQQVPMFIVACILIRFSDVLCG